ncbi:MAG TPA: hypothetical protein VME23_06545 [Terracidiphilus sp.]|nr:hypothetical protein [Terracidiphilus sp.]
MSAASTYAIASPPPYDSPYDTANAGQRIPWFGNDQVDDCVIVARAHHTIRLDYAYSKPVPSISISDVINEYRAETDRTGTTTIDLGHSLREWRDSGWTVGGGALRKIADVYGPYLPTPPNPPPNYPDSQMAPAQIMNGIYQYSGAHVQLLLPQSIDSSAPDSYGNQILWSDTSGFPARAHAMLLTGYDHNGPIGLTWGVRQHMTWEFLHRYCSYPLLTGIFFVIRGETT